MVERESPGGWNARRLALRLTLVTGGATVLYRVGRPLVRRLRERFGRRAQPTSTPDDHPISLARFHDLHEGMTESAAIELLGPRFLQVNGSVTPRAETRTLRWVAQDARAVVHAVFQNGRLVAKDQRGLA
jgi:hypothetical protein